MSWVRKKCLPSFLCLKIAKFWLNSSQSCETKTATIVPKSWDLFINFVKGYGSNRRDICNKKKDNRW